MDKTPLYKHPGAYAKEHDELPVYRASNKANIACKEAIEAAVSAHYSDNRLNPGGVKQVVDQFGYERTFYVLANTVKSKDWDARISRDNKEWAKNISVVDNPDAWGSDRNCYFVVDKCHPGLTDLFINQARHEYQLTQPLSKDDIQREAEKIQSRMKSQREPNSPSGTHFMVQVSEDFMFRASSKDTDRLCATLPWDSLSLSSLKDKPGVYAMISKDEQRDKPLRQPKRSLIKKIKETQAALDESAPIKSADMEL